MRARPSPKRSLTSATAASRSHSAPSSCAGRQGSSTGAGQQHGPQLGELAGRPGRAAAAWPRRPRRCRRAGCSGPASRSGSPSSRRTPYPAWCTVSLPPGAQAPSHGASSRLSTGVEPGAAEAGPALAGRRGVHALGLRDLVRRDPEQDDVVDDVGVARQHVGASEVGVLLEPGIQQEAAVVVGADAGRCGRLVGLGHPQGEPSFAGPQRLRRGGRSLGVVAAVRPVGGRGLLGRPVELSCSPAALHADSARSNTPAAASRAARVRPGHPHMLSRRR